MGAAGASAPLPLQAEDRMPGPGQGSSSAGSRGGAGTAFGEYELLEKIGEGGMGEVFRARQVSLRRTVALKIVARGSPVSPQARSRFLREAALVAKLSHPAVVPVYQAGEVEGQPFYAMELVQGQALDEYVRRAGLRGRQVVALLLAVCDGVQAAHQRGIVHRDLKPANILVDAEGRPHILDFGLAKILTEEAAEFSLLTMDGKIVGTPAYMAPEQTLGRPDEVDTRTDVYALGLLLYQLLTGRMPYQISGEMVAVLLRIQRDPPVPPRRVVPGLPRDLEAILLRCLEKDRDRRYLSAGDLAADLRRFLAHEPVLAHAPGLAYRTGKFLRRHWLPCSVAALFAVTLAALGTAFVLRLRSERNRAVAAEQEAQANERAAVTARQDLEQVSRQAAPEFVAKADEQVARQDWDAAARAVDTALRLDPGLVPAWLAKGRLLLARDRFGEAAAAFAEAQAGIPAGNADEAPRARCREYARLAGRLRDAGAPDPILRLEVARGLGALGDVALAAVFAAAGGDALAGIEERLQAAVAALERLNPPFQADEKTISLNREVAHVGIWLNGHAEIRDISPLKGLPVSCLEIEQTSVTDLRPLVGMPVRHLNVCSIPATDFTPLRELSLRSLRAYGTRLADLSVLVDMPLEDLKLDGPCVRDLTPLGRLRTLKGLVVGGYECESLKPLSGLPIEFLELAASPAVLTDLWVLQTLSLKRLHISHPGLSDLDGLKGLQLEWLHLRDCPKVTDIACVKGMPLKTLGLFRTGVQDLGPLRGLPLVMLVLQNGEGTEPPDLSPLRDCTTLEWLGLPTRHGDIGFLRRHPRLKYLWYAGKQWYWPLYETVLREDWLAERFWREYDAQRTAGKP